MDTVKMSLSHYNELHKNLIDAIRDREEITNEHYEMLGKFDCLIASKMGEKLSSPFKYDEPTFVEIEEVAEIIGIDWEQKLNKWREDRKAYLEAKADEDDCK